MSLYELTVSGNERGTTITAPFGDMQEKTLTPGDEFRAELSNGGQLVIRLEPPRDFIARPESQKRAVEGGRIRLKVAYPVDIQHNIVIPAGREGLIITATYDPRDQIQLLQVRMDDYGGDPIWLDRKAIEVVE